MHTSSRCAPSRVWARAISTHSSQFSASMASRNALDPLALVRSPIARNDASWCRSVCEYRLATPFSRTGWRSTTGRARTASTTRRRCSGVVPQHPPTSPRPNSPTNCVCAAASSSGVSGYVAPFGPSTGRPALGMHVTGISACRDRWRRCSLISAGPVAQLRPIASTSSACSVVSAAPISEPMSMVPVVSTVTCTITGTSRPTSRIALRDPVTAAFAWSRSWLVSTRIASTPPSSRPAACSANVSRRCAYVVCPRLGSLVPGPIEPSTQRGSSSVANASARSRAIRAPAAASSRIRSSMS